MFQAARIQMACQSLRGGNPKKGKMDGDIFVDLVKLIDRSEGHPDVQYLR